MSQLPSLLIVDDEKNTREALQRLLSSEYETHIACNADEAINAITQTQFRIILTDLRLGGNKSGLSVIQFAKNTPCVMMTAFADIETAVSAMKIGAFDFITKPLDLKHLKIILQQALKESNYTSYEKTPQVTTPFRNDLPIIVDDASSFNVTLNNAKKVAHTNANILLFGETGTGKEILANTIHKFSPRVNFPLIAVHCASLSSTLLESELFGHEKGAFTGATNRRIGYFESANKGTLFLDEIGEIDAATQVKLLRFLETHTLERVGGNEPIKVDIRIVSATNKDLRKLVDEGKFREDLFYRLNVIELKVPPLRERVCDIPLLFNYYLRHFAEELQIETPTLDPMALSKICQYPWPGNIRELKNTCEGIIALLPEGKKDISVSDLGEKFT